MQTFKIFEFLTAINYLNFALEIKKNKNFNWKEIKKPKTAAPGAENYIKRNLHKKWPNNAFFRLLLALVIVVNLLPLIIFHSKISLELHKIYSSWKLRWKYKFGLKESHLYLSPRGFCSFHFKATKLLIKTIW